jgi:hypothetical protein
LNENGDWFVTTQIKKMAMYWFEAKVTS